MTKLQKIIEKIKVFAKDFGKIGSIAGLTAALPSVGSMILLLGIYQISPWLQSNKEIGIPSFILFMTIFSGVALIATNVLGIVSGFAFSFQWGLLAQILGILGASTVMFFIARRFAAETLQSKIAEKPKLKAIHQALLKENSLKTLAIVCLIRMSIAMPFAVTNLMMSAAGVSLRTYLTGTLLGMLPRATAVVFVGANLSELDLSQPNDLWILILGGVATIVAVIVVSIISKRALDRLTIEQGV